MVEVQSYGVHRDVEMQTADLDDGARESDTTMAPERATRGTYDSSYGTLRPICWPPAGS